MKKDQFLCEILKYLSYSVFCVQQDNGMNYFFLFNSSILFKDTIKNYENKNGMFWGWLNCVSINYSPRHDNFVLMVYFPVRSKVVNWLTSTVPFYLSISCEFQLNTQLVSQTRDVLVYNHQVPISRTLN